MEQKRNSYLVSSSMKKFLTASIAAMLIQNVNAIVDGILMGRFLGTEAFSAVNLCLPVVGLLTTIAMLFYTGANVLASVALGAREEKRANSIYTVSMSSVGILSVVVTITAILGVNLVTAVICREEALRGYTRDYLFVYFAGTAVIMLVSALLGFGNVGGKPKLVTRASLTNVITNIVCDVLYVKILGMGIKGAALATITGAFLSAIIVIADWKVKGSPFKFCRVGSETIPILKEIVHYGVSVTSQTFAIVIYSYVCAILAQVFCGVYGAFVGSLLAQATSLGQGVSGGMGKAFNAIGGMLKGQKDDAGVLMLYKKGMKVAVLVAVAFVAVFMILARPYAMLMGAENEELLRYSVKSLRMALPFIIPVSFVWIIPNIYALGGQLSILPIISISQPVLTGLGLIACGSLISNDYMWIGYPISAVLIFLLVVFLSERVRKKSDEKLGFISLLPVPDKRPNVYDISVPCDKDGLIDTLRELNTFFEGQDIDKKLGMRVRLCIEEMVSNIVEFGGRKKNQFLDLKIVVDEQEISAIIKDDGKQFDPITAEKKGSGLKILNGLCPDLDYKYSYGQNMLFMNWVK
ncbi:MATE family efflux transporter [Butyrivibrio proteoclasticus]|uniref:MATE family efflux transporter n=1 Tax=Butyrivibrio proteoclasticus TaxID=43305 RepID=UPI000478D45F|nr:MATE family efflux transporter [Butyrivibrio proteoclasticus]